MVPLPPAESVQSSGRLQEMQNKILNELFKSHKNSSLSLYNKVSQDQTSNSWKKLPIHPLDKLLILFSLKDIMALMKNIHIFIISH